MQLQVDDNKGRHLSSKAVANRAETGNRRAEEFPHTDRAASWRAQRFRFGSGTGAHPQGRVTVAKVGAAISVRRPQPE